MPKVGLSLGSSFEKLFNKALDPSKLYVFGCSCFPWLRPYSSHKLNPKSNPCVFLGYSLTQSAFLCFDPTLKKIFVSSHVKFVENVFLFVSLFTSTTPVIDQPLYSSLHHSSCIIIRRSPTNTANLTRIALFITNTPLVLSSSYFSPIHTVELTRTAPSSKPPYSSSRQVASTLPIPPRSPELNP